MPCSPGMANCAATCAHRAWVMEHRYDRSVWEVKRDEGGLGYDQETRDWEALNPSPRLKDKMLHREKPPEETPVTYPEIIINRPADREAAAAAEHTKRLMAADNLSEVSIPSPPPPCTAEEQVLGIAMMSTKPEAVLGLMSLSPKEFIAAPENQVIAEAIQELVNMGETHSALDVTQYLHDTNRPLPYAMQGALDHRNEQGRWQQPDVAPGLQAMVDNAMPVQTSMGYAADIRTRYRAHSLEQIGQKIQALARGAVTEGWQLTDGVDAAIAKAERQLAEVPKGLDSSRVPTLYDPILPQPHGLGTGISTTQEMHSVMRNR